MMKFVRFRGEEFDQTSNVASVCSLSPDFEALPVICPSLPKLTARQDYCHDWEASRIEMLDPGVR
jgi:hypothetical protein